MKLLSGNYAKLSLTVFRLNFFFNLSYPYLYSIEGHRRRDCSSVNDNNDNDDNDIDIDRYC